MFWKATDHASRLNYSSSESGWKRPSYKSIAKHKSLLSLGVGLHARTRLGDVFFSTAKKRFFSSLDLGPRFSRVLTRLSSAGHVFETLSISPHPETRLGLFPKFEGLLDGLSHAGPTPRGPKKLRRNQWRVALLRLVERERERTRRITVVSRRVF